MKRLLSAVAFAVMAALTLAGCGGSDNTASSGTSSSSSSKDFNQADVTFAQSMILHHEQAVEMAQMAQMHAATNQVRELADKIAAAQGPEIKTMSGWLKDWGKKGPSSDKSGGMDHDMGSMGSGDMPGMMTDADMKDLGSATGAAFDQMWLTMMTKHHTGAIAMAKTEQSDGKSKHAVTLATKIEADQTAEIADMKTLLKAS